MFIHSVTDLTTKCWDISQKYLQENRQKHLLPNHLRKYLFTSEPPISTLCILIPIQSINLYPVKGAKPVSTDIFLVIQSN
jgi:hypothetical protein